jgi:ATP-dependent Clp protease ATP-binding subunit ClpA
MFERFTKEAREAVISAVEEAWSRSEARVGTEHLLLGLSDSNMMESLGLNRDTLRQELNRLDGDALEAIGIDPELLEIEAAETLGPFRRRRHLPFTGAAKDMLKGALKEALVLEHRYIGAEHVLLAITRLPAHDRAIRMMSGIGWEPDQMRASLLTLMRQAS